MKYNYEEMYHDVMSYIHAKGLFDDMIKWMKKESEKSDR